jgi:UDP-GlcNAc:undecaprenyl-phosphate GlcNAc-1-phosphate transferase
LQYIILFSTAFVLSLVITPSIKKLAIKYNLVASPKEDRWHKRVTPIMGGVAILLSFFIPLIVFHRFFFNFPLSNSIWIFLLCSFILFSLGLLDDVKNIPPQGKLIGQIVAAAILIKFGYTLDWFDSLTLNTFITIIWIVGITNAFNLLDNMDGLATGIAFIACLFIFLISWLNPDLQSPSFQSSLSLTLILMGSLLGFLVYNFNPASIFMGDAGSLFVGFYIAGLTISGDLRYSTNLLSIISVPVLILFIPIFDVSLVTVMRKVFGRPISQGGRDHTSHRLVAIGFSEKKAVLLLYTIAVLAGSIALGIQHINIHTSLMILFLFIVGLIFSWLYLAKVRVYPKDQEMTLFKNSSFTPLLIEFTYKRRIFEVLLDLMLIPLAYYGSYLLRFEGFLIGHDFRLFLESLPIIIASQILCFFIFGVYKGVWRYTGINDIITYLKAVTSGTILSVLIILFLYRFMGFSRSVFIIDWIILFLFLSGSRLSFRMIGELANREKNSGRKVLIYGAGDGGEFALREILNNKKLGLIPTGFLDDDPKKYKRMIHGYPILGGIHHLKKILSSHKVSEVLVACRNLEESRLEKLKATCGEMGIELKWLTFSIKSHEAG